MFSFKKYQKIQKNIELLGKKSQIIAISKNHPLEEVEKAISFGLEVFGENKVQEAKSKFEEIKNTNKMNIFLCNIILYFFEQGRNCLVNI